MVCALGIPLVCYHCMLSSYDPFVCPLGIPSWYEPMVSPPRAPLICPPWGPQLGDTLEGLLAGRPFDPLAGPYWGLPPGPPSEDHH